MRRNVGIRLAAGIGVGAAIAAGAVLAVAGTGFGGNSVAHSTGQIPPTGCAAPHNYGDAPGAPLWDHVNRSHGVLQSLDVNVSPSIPNATIQLEVLHWTAWPSDGVVVYKTEVSATCIPAPTPETGPTGRYGPTGANATGASTWYGTLSPKDWSGGCESGVYGLSVEAVAPGTSLADGLKPPYPSERDGGARFKCYENPAPPVNSGPTGATGSTG